MKKRVLKMISLMMAAVLMLGCAACGNSGEGAAETGNGDTAEADNADAQPADDGAEAADGEKVTITLWSQFSDPNSTDGNYVAFYNALESIKTDMPNVEVVHEGTESESSCVESTYCRPLSVSVLSIYMRIVRL